MIKLIVLDIDGTLLTSQKTVSPATIQAIQEAKKNGIRVVICTGRPILGVQSLLETLQMTGADDYVISFNGGLIQNVATREVVYSKTHSLADIKRIYDTLYAVNLPMNAIDSEKVYVPTYPSQNQSLYPETMSKALILEEKQWREFDDNHRFQKAVCCTSEYNLKTIFNTLPTQFLNAFECYTSKNILMEIMPKGVTKASGIQQLCALLNISMAHVMAIGDEENDLPMIEAVGYGVAMGNAIDKVKQTAKYITQSNDADGVANAIYRYALNKQDDK